MMNKKIYTIDFTNIKYFWEIHEIIRKSLDFPDYYGCNWDAFWDCLTDMYGEPLHIIIIGLDIIEQKFDDAANKIISIFRRFKHYEKSFEKDILIEIVIDGVRKVLK
ncbi:MAG: barnase inhibitor [Ruminococcaceae bacterium]|nr:barnase inhibitor [Oscillospiraceae bacterium]